MKYKKLTHAEFSILCCVFSTSKQNQNFEFLEVWSNTNKHVKLNVTLYRHSYFKKTYSKYRILCHLLFEMILFWSVFVHTDWENYDFLYKSCCCLEFSRIVIIIWCNLFNRKTLLDHFRESISWYAMLQRSQTSRNRILSSKHPTFTKLPRASLSMVLVSQQRKDWFTS